MLGTENWITRVRDGLEVEELAIDVGCSSYELNDLLIEDLKRGAMRAAGCAGFQVEAVVLPENVVAPRDLMMQVASLSEAEKLHLIEKLFVINDQNFGLGRSIPVVIPADADRSRDAWIEALAYGGILKNRAPVLIATINEETGSLEKFASLEAATIEHGVRSMLL